MPPPGHLLGRRAEFQVLRLDDAGRTTFAALVASLYRHLFGAVPIDEAEYLEFGASAQQVTRGGHVLPA